MKAPLHDPCGVIKMCNLMKASHLLTKYAFDLLTKYASDLLTKYASDLLTNYFHFIIQ